MRVAVGAYRRSANQGWVGISGGCAGTVTVAPVAWLLVVIGLIEAMGWLMSL